MARLSLEEGALRRVPFVVEPIEPIAGFRLDDSRRGNQKLLSRRKRAGAVLAAEVGDPSPHQHSPHQHSPHQHSPHQHRISPKAGRENSR
jgi:hypothetical protein